MPISPLLENHSAITFMTALDKFSYPLKPFFEDNGSHSQGLKMSSSTGSGAARKFLFRMARRKFVIMWQEISGILCGMPMEYTCLYFHLPTNIKKMLNLLQFCSVEILTARP